MTKGKNTCKRNKKVIKPKNHISKRLKTIVWDYRMGLEVGMTECPCCGHNQISQSEFHCGHIIAESKGGGLKKDNLVPICSQCNLSMGSKNMSQFMNRQFDRNLKKILKLCTNFKNKISDIIKLLKINKNKKTIKLILS